MATPTATRGRQAATGELTEQQKQEYWRYNVTLTTILLVIWFVVTYIISGVMAGWLNQYTILGFPLGYYMAAQGSLAVFVLEIATYTYLMNKKAIEYGSRVENLADHEPGQDLRFVHTRIPGRDRAHRDRGGDRPLQQSDDWLDLHGAVAADLRLHRHRDPHVEPGPVLRRRARRTRGLQRHGDRLR